MMDDPLHFMRRPWEESEEKNGSRKGRRGVGEDRYSSDKVHSREPLQFYLTRIDRARKKICVRSSFCSFEDVASMSSGLEWIRQLRDVEEEEDDNDDDAFER